MAYDCFSENDSPIRPISGWPIRLANEPGLGRTKHASERGRNVLKEYDKKKLSHLSTIPQ